MREIVYDGDAGGCGGSFTMEMREIVSVENDSPCASGRESATEPTLYNGGLYKGGGRYSDRV
jgi:hypothetical protein